MIFNSVITTELIHSKNMHINSTTGCFRFGVFVRIYANYSEVIYANNHNVMAASPSKASILGYLLSGPIILLLGRYIRDGAKRNDFVTSPIND